MTVATTQSSARQQGGGGAGSGNLYDILDLILDKGLVIDVFVRVSLVGIELLTIDARIVVASVDTYLRFAEACNRLDLQQSSSAKGLPDLVGDMTEKGAKGKSKGALTGAAETFAEQFKKSSGGDEQEKEPAQRPKTRSTRRGGGSSE
ncbi:gas vesicle structural protein GvpA [Amycolatopsis samaneae]|uniref:Gas vesicle protein A n=1 Tax=Amycolatopsis samaneae TaxID=664691 RepID=A0ABW5GSK4_9PSEU